MTKFNTLPMVSAQLQRLANDAGFQINLDTEIPQDWETASLVVEGIFQELQKHTVGSYLFKTASMREVFAGMFGEVDMQQPLSDFLCDNPEACHVIHTSYRHQFRAGMRASARFIDEYMESAFDGDIANAIAMF